MATTKPLLGLDGFSVCGCLSPQIFTDNGEDPFHLGGTHAKIVEVPILVQAELFYQVVKVTFFLPP